MKNTKDNLRITKYLDLPDFLSLINKEALFFPLISNQEDPFEGKLPSIDNYKKIYKEVKQDAITDLINRLKKTPDDRFCIFETIFNMCKYIEDRSQVEEILRSVKRISGLLTSSHKKDVKFIEDHLFEKVFFKNFQYHYNKIKDYTIINCWYKSDFESDGMWKLYANRTGVAIQTTLKKLKEKVNAYVQENKKLNFKLHEEINEVKYPPDYDDLLNKVSRCPAKEFGVIYENIQKKYNVNIINRWSNWYFFKRKCFEHEKELRALISTESSIDLFGGGLKENPWENENGGHVKIEPIEEFIDLVILSPYAPSYYKTMIEGILYKLCYKKLSKKVIDSQFRVG